MIKTSRQSILLFVAWMALLGVPPASAQAEFPTRPIKLIVPFPAGGGIDVTARIAAQALGDVLGQQVVVQNQGGAGGAIATDSVVKSEPDGYTLLYHSTTGIVHAAVTYKLPYDWMRDLAPVSIVTRFAPVMIVSPTLPVKDLREFIALLKANPGKYSFRIVGHRYSGPSGGGIIQAESRRRHASHTLSRDFRRHARPADRTGCHDDRRGSRSDAEHPQWDGACACGDD